MRFELKAIGSDGSVQAIDFQAPDETTAVRSLEGRGYTILSVRTKPSLALPWRRGAERLPVAPLSEELRVRGNAGPPRPEAIDTLAPKEKRDEFGAVIEGPGEAQRDGRSLSAALHEFPHVFSALYVAT